MPELFQSDNGITFYFLIIIIIIFSLKKLILSFFKQKYWKFANYVFSFFDLGPVLHRTCHDVSQEHLKRVRRTCWHILARMWKQLQNLFIFQVWGSRKLKMNLIMPTCAFNNIFCLYQSNITLAKTYYCFYRKIGLMISFNSIGLKFSVGHVLHE